MIPRDLDDTSDVHEAMMAGLRGTQAEECAKCGGLTVLGLHEAAIVWRCLSCGNHR